MSTSIISLNDYFGDGQWLDHPDATDEVKANAQNLIDRVNPLLQEALDDGVVIEVNPVTGSYVSGLFHGLGGFRPQDCKQGAPGSSHKKGEGTDTYDANGQLDAWCMAHQDRLQHYGLYMEHPDYTIHWCHLSTRRPKSGHTVFIPK